MAHGAEGADEALTAAGFTGGCQCGAVRYQIKAEKLVSYACHCRECQKQSASAFGISVPVFEANFEAHGELYVWSRKTDSGSTTDCYYCPKCGTRLYHSGANRPGLITVKGGSLDAIADLPLVAHLWTSRKMAWVALDDDIPQWETQPASTQEWMKLLGWSV